MIIKTGKKSGRAPELLDRRHISRTAGPVPGSEGHTANLAVIARLLELLGRPARGANLERAGARWVGAPGAVTRQVSDVPEGAPQKRRAQPGAAVARNSCPDATGERMSSTL